MHYMNKFVTMLTLSAITLVLAPQARAADLYANSVVSNSFADVWSPQNALGEPDGLYTDFRDEETYIKLDMGEGEEGRDGLTLFYQSLNYGATAVVTFYSADNLIIGTDSQLFAAGAAAEWTAILYSTETFRYVKIESPELEQWKLDAVQALAINSPVIAEEDVVTEPTAEEETTDEVTDDLTLADNTLIKTDDSASVYVIGAAGQRHPFPNEVTFFSWGYSFDDVTIVDAETMSTFLIGDSVTIKPGTYLVKVQTIPKVYAVAPGHTLRWITSEDLAIEIYGNGWANEVIDISDAFWPDYVEGEIINTVNDVVGWETETQPF